MILGRFFESFGVDSSDPSKHVFHHNISSTDSVKINVESFDLILALWFSSTGIWWFSTNICTFTYHLRSFTKARLQLFVELAIWIIIFIVKFSLRTPLFLILRKFANICEHHLIGSKIIMVLWFLWKSFSQLRHHTQPILLIYVKSIALHAFSFIMSETHTFQ